MYCIILHIDLDFISGIVYDAANKKSYQLKSKDTIDPDNYWLYFEVDHFNQRVKNKKDFDQQVFNKAPGFIGNLFSRNLKEETFLLNDQNHPILELLNCSNMLPSIKEQCFKHSGINEIDTFLTYSDNIELTKRDYFTNFLSKNGFNIISDVLSLSEMFAYSITQSRKEIKDVLYLEAINDNLNISTLTLNDTHFVRKDLDANFGMGADPRKKIIVEYVINELKRETPFLKKQEDRNNEYKRQSKNANDWLSQLSCIKDELILNDITLAICDRTKYRVKIVKSEIEEKTGGYINELIAKYRTFKINFFKDTEPYVILFGETLTNTQIKKRFIDEVGSNSISLLTSKDFFEALSLYPIIWDLAQQRLDETKKQSDYEVLITEAEGLHKKQKFEESLSKLIAARKRFNTEIVNKKIIEIESVLKENQSKKEKFDRLKEQAKKSIELNKFIEAEVFLKEALELFPDDDEAKKTLNHVSLQISVEKQKISDLIKDADYLFKSEQWSNAKDIYEKILKIEGDNKHALSRKRECERIISLGPIVINADKLFSEHKYKEAMVIYKQGIPDAYCLQQHEKCSNILSLYSEIKKLMVELNPLNDSKNIEKMKVRFDELSQICKKIEIIDSANKEYEASLKTYKQAIEDIVIQKPKIEKITQTIKAEPKYKPQIEKTANNRQANNEQNKEQLNNNEGERLFKLGKFLDAKRIFDNLLSDEPNNKYIGERITTCCELLKNERLLKAMLTEAEAIKRSNNIAKAKERLSELLDIENLYKKHQVFDERIDQIKYNLTTVK